MNDSHEQSSGRTKTALELYLEYYQNREDPKYAVLVIGAWGIGKTFQVLRAIPKDKHYYVSLFGMRDPDALSMAVIAEMYPTKSELAGQTTKLQNTNLLGIPVGALSNLAARYMLRFAIKNDRTIIFDDLERATISPRDLLGAINHYVEHHKCRVVVIAHEDKLTQDLLDQKEKLFGQVIKVQPEIDLAYDEFAKKLGNDDDQEFLNKFRSEFVDLFNESSVASLRILRHTLEDSLRLLRCLSPEQRDNPEAIRELFRLFVALNFESRFGRLKPENISNRDRQRYAHQVRLHSNKTEAAETPPFVAAQQRYPTTRLDSTMLSDDLLREMLFDGNYDAARITKSIQLSSYFAKPADQPAWRTFIEFQEQTDDIAEDAMRCFNEDFEGRRIIEPGEMLHMFALRLMQAKNELIQRTIENVVTDCKQYVDDLRARGELRATPFSQSAREDLRQGYGGIGYWVEDLYQKEFDEIYAYLNKARREVMLDSLVECAPEILRLVKTDGQSLYSILNYTASNTEKFASVPILAVIKPQDFVDSWLQSHPRNWYWIRNAIEERFKRPPDEGRNDKEKPWASQVAELLDAEAKRVGSIRGLRIRRNIPNLPQSEKTN